MFARFDENPAMTLRVIKETKRYGRKDNVKTVYPLQTKFAGVLKQIIPNYMGLDARETVAKNKGADQPAHPRRLISAFVISFFKSTISKHASSKISMLWLVSVA